MIRTGSVPAQLVKLRSLRHLDLSNNLLSGKYFEDVEPGVCSCCSC